MTFAEIQFIGWSAVSVLVFLWAIATYSMMDG